MGNLVLAGATSGSITLEPTAVAGSNTLTLPASTGTILASAQALTVPNTTGTVMVSGNMPAFSAYAASTTSLANTANTTLIYDTKDFDTATCYNNTGSTVTLNGISVPAYSFAPNVAGYYQVNATHYVGFTGGSSNMALQIFKNGAQYTINCGASGINNAYMQASGLVYCNGTSDYISIVMYWTGAGASTGSGTGYKFQAYLARSA